MQELEIGWTDIISEHIRGLIGKNQSNYSKCAPKNNYKIITSGLIQSRYHNSSLAYNFLSADFTGDGSDDILTTNTSGTGSGRVLNNLLLYKSDNNGTSFTTSVIPTYPGYSYINPSGNFIFPGDFDGDGVQDILTILGSSTSNFFSHLYFGNNSTTFGTVGTTGTVNFAISDWASMDQIHVLDFNGDGKSDLMLIKDNTCEILTFNGWVARRVYYSTSFLSKNHLIYIGDFNGDSKTDLLVRSSLTNNAAAWTKALSNGKSFITSAFTFQHTPDITGQYSDDHFTITDYNGDGRMDIYHGWNYFVGGTASTSRLDLYYSQGSNGFNYIQQTFSSLLGFVGNQVYDLNGDGRSDNVNITYYGDPFDIFYFKKDGKENLLEKVKNGHNHITEYYYKKLNSAGAFYSRGIFTPHPLNSVQPSLNCVSDFKVQNGIGSNYNTTQYSYEEATLNKTGKGFLGFKKVAISDLTTGIKVVSEYEFNTTFFAAAPYRTSSYLISTEALLNQSTLTNEFVDLGNKRFWYRVNGIEENKVYEGQTINTTNTYDSDGNLTISVINKNNVETTTTTSAFGAYVTTIPNKPTSVTVSNTRAGQPGAYTTTTAYDYNNLGQMISKTDFSGLTKNIVTTYEYFPLGNLKNITISPNSVTPRTTSITYDTKGRFSLTTTNVLGQVSSATYDSRWGKPLSLIGIDGLTSSNEYDAFGRLKKTTYPEGFSVIQSYGWSLSNGAVWYGLVDYDQPGKPAVKTYYDVLDREIKSETEGFQSEIITKEMTYDARGNMATTTQPYKAGETVLVSSNIYNEYNQLISSGNSVFGNTTTTYSYNLGKLTTTATKPNSQVSSKVTDAADRIVAVSDAAGSLTYTYSNNGNLLNVNAGNPVIVTNEYDAYGKQTKLIDQNSGTTTYSYDAIGQLIGQTNGNGQVSTSIYDVMGRVTSRTGPEGTTSYEYYTSGPSINKVKKVTGFTGNIEEFTYDGFGRVSIVKETVESVIYNTTYNYNLFGDVTSIVYPSGFGTNHAYDANGYPTTIKNNTNTVTLYTNTGMNGLGQNTTYSLGNTKSSTNTFYHGVPTQFMTAGVQNLEMSWNYGTGNLTQRKDNIKSKTEDFTYDNLNRLLTATVSGQTAQIMTYDNSGNISSKTDVGSYTYHASKHNAVTGVTNSQSTIPLLQQDIYYTSFMQPDQVMENGYELTYTYSADYERIKSLLKLNGTTINTRYYFGSYEKDLIGSATKHIHYITGLAGLIGIVVREDGIDTYNYIYTDHLGSVVTITSDNGTVIADQNFDAWGRRRNPTTFVAMLPTAANGLPASLSWLRRGYTGHEHLDNFGLINMNGRLYDPVVGRMLSPDNYIQAPDMTQSYNRYSYAMNNPMVNTDPDGHFWNFVIGAALGGFSGWQIGKAKGAKGWDMFGYIAAGVGIGIVTSGFGEAVAGATVAWGTVGSGVATGITTGFIGGAYNAALAGGDFWKGGLKGALLGGAIGGVMGVANAAINANKTVGDLQLSGETLTDNPVDFTRDSYMKFLGETGLDPDAVNTRIRLSNELLGRPDDLFFDETTKFWGKIGRDVTGKTGIAGTVREGNFFQQFFSSKTTTYIAEGAFKNAKLLYVITGHEFIHAFHASGGANIWANARVNALTERSAYGWSIMASKSIGYTNSAHLSGLRNGWIINNNILKGVTSNRFHWKYVPGIIKQ